MKKQVNQHGDKSVYIEGKVDNIYFDAVKTQLSPTEIMQNFYSASVDLSSYNNHFAGSVHIARTETNDLYTWILNDVKLNESPIAVLGGNAGYGKSVILRDLYDKLNENKIPVLGIKADRLFIHNLSELNDELNLGDNIESIFKTLSSNYSRYVFIIDQIDALSQSLSSDRNPLNTYHSLILKLSRIINIRIIISCRLYDLDYDPLLQEYKNKKVFMTSLLSISDVEDVLNQLNLQIISTATNVKEFLRVPLHLQLFSIIKNPAKFEGNVSLQILYDEIWRMFVLEKPVQAALETLKVQSLIGEVSEYMYNNQQLLIDKKIIEGKFKQEIDYLASEGIITQNNSDKIQFLHQSFFDYAYARIFIEKGVNISESLKGQHQGLFIRSRVRQVFTYLRELDERRYISELSEIIYGNYRFHIKLLLLNNLGFYSNPLPLEKVFVKERLSKDVVYLKLFLESVHSSQWFEFCIDEMKLLNYLSSNDGEFIDIIYNICWRIMPTNPENVIVFLEKLSLENFLEKDRFISRLLTKIPTDKIHLSLSLFHRTKRKWDPFDYYHFLTDIVIVYPDLVINELESKLDESLKTVERTGTEYIPGGYDGFRPYKELFDKNKDIAIPFFIRVTEKISNVTKIIYVDEMKNKDRIFESWAYYLYAPFKGHHYDHQKLYDIILKYLEDQFEMNFNVAANIIEPLINSDLAMIVNLPITFISKYPNRFKEYALFILTSPRLYNTSSEHVNYNLKELLKSSYSLFSDSEQKNINKVLVNISPEWEKRNINNQKGVSKYGYTRIGYTAYKYISMIPENARRRHGDVDEIYKVMKRKYGETENKEPQYVHVRSGESTLPSNAYEKMTNEQWKRTFNKYTSNSHFDLDIPTQTGHCRKFEDYVSKDPSKYIDLIDDIISDKKIKSIYSVYAMQGLKKAGYIPEKVRDLFIKFIQNHYYTELIDRESLIYTVWLTEYFIDTSTINKDIIDFLSHIVIYHPDEEMLNNDPINDGINRSRGAASFKLIQCYKFPEFEEEIFSSLELMAKNGAVHTRGAALYQLAYLNNLNMDRNLNLFLELVHDYHPLLMKMQLHDLHPLVYMIHVDFTKLLDFFQNAILIDAAKESIAHILFIAWLYDYDKSKELLDNVLLNSLSAQKKLVDVAFEGLEKTDFPEKHWEVIYRFLDVNDEEMGKAYEFGFHRLENINNADLKEFLNAYVISEVGKYRDYYFYELLLKKTKDYPRECIEWVLFKEYLKPDIQKRVFKNQPLQIIIQSYNAIRKYNINDPILESAIERFDEMLKNSEYRGGALEVLKNIDS